MSARLPDNTPPAADRRGLLVSKLEALVIEHGAEEVAWCLAVVTEDHEAGTDASRVAIGLVSSTGVES